MWAARRARNHEVTIPHGAAQLERVGNVMNFRLAGGQEGAYRGGNDDFGTTAPFLDSDVHKWLEAVGWELAQASRPGTPGPRGPGHRADREERSGTTATSTRSSRWHVRARSSPTCEWGHELYVAGHLIQAAVAWQRGLGDDRLLRIAERFVDRIWRELGPGPAGARVRAPGDRDGARGALSHHRVASVTWSLPALLVERRGRGLLAGGRFGDSYWQDHEPVRTATRACWPCRPAGVPRLRGRRRGDGDRRP